MRVVSSLSSIEIPAEIAGTLKDSSGIVWLGINSFEERCLASLTRLCDSGVPLAAVYFVDYPTVAFPEADDRRIRKSHREAAALLAQRAGAAFYNPSVEAYASAGLETVLGEYRESGLNCMQIIDISCLTKIHVVTIANFVSLDQVNFKETLLAYTSPRAYGNLDRVSKRIGWNDVIIAPVAATARMRNEGYSRGIVIAGHESERLWSALNEIEPASGLLILGRIPTRPDITRLSEKINKGVIKHMALDYSEAWSKRVVDISDVDAMMLLIEHEVQLAKSADAPIILYPFGPKSLIFASAKYLLEYYPHGSWFVYPVPAGYDLTYSEGSGGTYWFSSERNPSEIQI